MDPAGDSRPVTLESGPSRKPTSHPSPLFVLGCKPLALAMAMAMALALALALALAMTMMMYVDVVDDDDVDVDSLCVCFLGVDERRRLSFR